MPDPDPPDVPTRPDDAAPRRRDWGDADRRDDPDDYATRRRRRRPRPADYYDRPHRGGVILALGIASIMLCNCCPYVGPFISIGVGLAAWLLGSGDLAAMDAGEMDPAGRSNTHAGRVCGMIGAPLAVGYAVLIVTYIAVMFAVGK